MRSMSEVGLLLVLDVKNKGLIFGLGPGTFFVDWAMSVTDR